MSSPFRAYIGGVLKDFDELFAARTTAAGPNTGYRVGGVDIANLYERTGGGDLLSANTGYRLSNGLDLKTAFKKYTPGPEITVQPVTQDILEGESLSFSITATGDGTLHYQWQRNTGSGWTNVGSDTNTLTYNPASRTDQGLYRCDVTDDVGTTQSQTVDGFVSYPPDITVQPVGGTLNPGNVASFTVSATDGRPIGRLYQWRKNTVDITAGTEGGKYAGYNTYNLTFVCAEGDDGASFDCVVSNAKASVTSSAAILHVNQPPEAPTGLTATAVSSSEIDLSWTASAGATSYTVQVWNGVTFVNLATGVGSTAYNATGLSASTLYEYVVLAVNGAGTSDRSNEASATTFSNLPGAPSGLVATAVSSSQINLSWSAGTNATSYNVKRWDWDLLNYATIANVGSTSYSDSGLAASTEYWYVITTVNAYGESGWSNEDSAATLAAGGGWRRWWWGWGNDDYDHHNYDHHHNHDHHDHHDYDDPGTLRHTVKCAVDYSLQHAVHGSLQHAINCGVEYAFDGRLQYAFDGRLQHAI